MTTTSRQVRRANARKDLESCGFKAQLPIEVVDFTGHCILAGGRGARTATDFHVVDARGRTIKRYLAHHDSVSRRRRRAVANAEMMTEILRGE